MRLAASAPKTIAFDELGRMADILRESTLIRQEYADHVQTGKFDASEIRKVGFLIDMLESVLAKILVAMDRVVTTRASCALPDDVVAALEAIEKDEYGHNVFDFAISRSVVGLPDLNADENSA